MRTLAVGGAAGAGFEMMTMSRVAKLQNNVGIAAGGEGGHVLFDCDGSHDVGAIFIVLICCILVAKDKVAHALGHIRAPQILVDQDGALKIAGPNRIGGVLEQGQHFLIWHVVSHYNDFRLLDPVVWMEKLLQKVVNGRVRQTSAEKDMRMALSFVRRACVR